MMLAILSVGMMPAIAMLGGNPTAIAQTAQRPDVKLQLVGEKRQVSRNAQGQEKTTWQAVANQATTRPGDILRYTLSGKNQGARPANKFGLKQPIPKGTVYVMNSASQQSDVEVLFSIDNGKSFTTKPMIPVMVAGKTEMKPAPASMYSHVQWKWKNAIAPGSAIQASYQVQVR